MLPKLSSSWTISKITLIVLCFIQVFTLLNIKPWKNAEEKNSLIDWDVTSYYAYLPAYFVHNDLSLKFIEEDTINYQAKHQFWPETAPNGGKVIKTTMGMSLLYFPFFMSSHLYASFSDSYTANGFSKPYEIGLAFSCVCYLFIGFLFIRRALLKCFSENITSFVLLSLLLGTNLFYYATTEPCMSHAYTFSLTGVLLYYTPTWLNKFSLKSAIFFGLFSGLLVLMRPTNLIILCMILMYGIQTRENIKNRLLWLLRNKKLLLISFLLGFMVLFPQLLYWKTITGDWVFNSYVGEYFYFNKPNIIEFLFSYRKGWLLYTPIMCFFILGIYNLFKTKNPWALYSLFSLIVTIYVFSSWWCWWYGGSFGMRCMIDFYPIFAFGLAANLKSINVIKRLFFSVGMFLLILFNLFQTTQRRNRVIHWDSMTKESYWTFFGVVKMKTNKDWEMQEKLIKKPDYIKAKKGEKEYDFSVFN
jgi:hypothetical protein